ncbi:MAG: hypothetical protein QW304_06540 [Thermoproteota archaeon]
MSQTSSGWFRWLAAVSGVSVILCGVLLAAEAPSLLVESLYVEDGQSYSLTYVTRFPILPVFTIILGILILITVLKSRRFLIPLASLCLGLIPNVLLAFGRFAGFSYEGLHVVKFGFPFSWLAWSPSLPLTEPRIMGVVALPFLIDLAFWSLLWLVFFHVARVDKLRL